MEPPTVGVRRVAGLSHLIAPIAAAATVGLMASRMFTAPEPVSVPVITLGFESHPFLQTERALPPKFRCYARPVPSACIADALDILVDAGVARIAINLDLGGREPRLPGEIAPLAQSMQTASEPHKSVRVLVPHDTPSSLRPATGWGGVFHAAIETSGLFGGRASSVEVGELLPLSLTLPPPPDVPLGSTRAWLPWTAARDHAGIETWMIEELADPARLASLKGRAVILAARFDCPDHEHDCRPADAPRRAIDEMALPTGPTGASDPVPGSHVHALLAGYALAGGTLWSPSWILTTLLVVVGAVGGIVGPRWAPAGAAVAYLGLGLLGWSWGLVSPAWPALVLLVLDVVYRRLPVTPP